MTDTSPLLTGIGVALGGMSLHEMWRAWQERRGRTERHLATVHADGVEALMHQLMARVQHLEERDNECQRSVAELRAVVHRQRRRINHLERQLKAEGIDVSTDEDVPLFLDRETPQNGLPSV
jgi:hypothetical protein